MLRQILVSPATFIANRLLRLRKGTILSRYANLFLTFFISGILHSLAETAGGLPFKRSGTMQFFITQAIGITFEDTIKSLWGGQTKKEFRKMPIALRLVGYTWVAMFLMWTTPGWLYPDAAGPPKQSFLPFSVVKSLVKV